MYGYGYRYNSGLVIGAGGGAPFNTKSILFDGVDDYLDCGVTGNINSLPNLSISCWFKTTTTDANSIIVGSDSQSNGRRFLLSSADSSGIKLRFLYFKTFSTYGIIYSTSNINDGNWHHVLAVNNGTNMLLYLDGILESSNADGGIIQTAVNTPLNIGRRDYLGSHFNFAGNVDEVAIWGTDQSSNIATLSTAPTVDLSSLSPLAWYRNGDNGAYKSPQWLIPNNENKDKVSNYSMEFFGIDQHLNIGAPSVLSNTSNFSISCWVKQTTSAINYRRVFGKYASASDMIFLGTAATTNYFTFYITNGGATSGVVSNVGIGFNVWKHVTLVYDGTLTGNQNRAKIYVDGVNVTATDSGTIPATTTADASDFYLGKVNGLGSFYYYGNMDEFAIFDYSLTPAEVLSISSEPTDLTSLSPTSWLKLGDNSTFAGGVWTVVDEVGTNDGSSVNMDIEDRIGEAPNSENNGLSFNMDFVDVVPDVP